MILFTLTYIFHFYNRLIHKEFITYFFCFIAGHDTAQSFKNSVLKLFDILRQTLQSNFTASIVRVMMVSDFLGEDQNADI